MTLTSIDLDRLEELASKATPGPWCVDNLAKVRSRLDGGKGLIANVSDGHYTLPREVEGCLGNADFIAALDPQTVLALIERLRRAEKENIKLRDVLIWSEENCPGKCAGVIRKALTGDK